MTTTAENITFIVVRGIVALAIIGLGFYCIGQGIQFFELPRVEAQQIHIHFVGLDITANGLGAVIFGTGVALCFVGQRTAPRRFEAKRTIEAPAQGAVAPSSELPQLATIIEETTTTLVKPPGL
jgi:hypothetical protein